MLPNICSTILRYSTYRDINFSGLAEHWLTTVDSYVWYDARMVEPCPAWHQHHSLETWHIQLCPSTLHGKRSRCSTITVQQPDSSQLRLSIFHEDLSQDTQEHGCMQRWVREELLLNRAIILYESFAYSREDGILLKQRLRILKFAWVYKPPP